MWYRTGSGRSLAVDGRSVPAAPAALLLCVSREYLFRA
eukprot:COSAG01_NODE_7227_length_3296_cov_1.581483_3_plen_38_part_00